MEEHQDDYRNRQIAFVSNLEGATMAEILLISLSLPIGAWLLAETRGLVKLGSSLKPLPKLDLHDFVEEILLVVLPVMMTVLRPSCVVSLFLAMGLIGWSSRCFCSGLKIKNFSPSTLTPRDPRSSNGTPGFPSPSFMITEAISNFRGGIMLLTCIAILAVDFQVFPRRFAKAEVFGTGLMDLGVGASVFASGLVSGYKRDQSRVKARAAGSTWTWRSYLRRLGSVAVRSWVLAVLGISRFVVIKGFAYQEHVSEYGVHWNFFATLFCIRIILAAVAPLRPARLRLIIALSALVVYQWMLLHDLSDYIINSPRNSFFSMNREGILGLVGFLCIHLLAEELGWNLRASLSTGRKISDSEGFSLSFLAKVAGLDICLWILTWASDRFIQRTSRRMMNVSYVIWVNAHLVCILGTGMLLGSLGSRPSGSRLLEAINVNMFPVFMGANLATGAVNLSLRTLDADDLAAVTIILIYIVLVSSFAVVLAKCNFAFRV